VQARFLLFILANIRFPASPEESVAFTEEAIAQASAERADLICFPECYVPGYRGPGKDVPPPDRVFLERAWAAIAACTAKASVGVVLGTERVEDDGLMATALVIDRDGRIAGFEDKVLLDEPYPENLPVVGACQICNQGLSLDEEYLACLIECARVGDVMPSAVEREKVRRILMKKPALASKLAQARVVGAEGNISFNAEIERVGKVLLKLARGHALFELNEPHLAEPERLGLREKF
jgi:Carbon-nitrogen hydrolase